MAEHPPPGARRPERRRLAVLPWALGGGLVLLALVLVASFDLFTPATSNSPTPVAKSTGPGVAVTMPGAAPGPPRDNELSAADRRIAALEQANADLARRLDLLQSAVTPGGETVATASAEARLREALLLGLARRRVDRGIPLGELEPLLAQTWASRALAELTALFAWSRAPVSRQSLIVRLEEIRAGPDPRPPAPGAGAGWGAQLQGWLGSLVQVRRASEEAPVRDVLADAGAALAAGDVESALARLPSASASPRLEAWRADARRLDAAQRALDALELRLAAELPPHPAAEPAAEAVPLAGESR